MRSIRLKKVRLSVTMSTSSMLAAGEYQGDDNKTPELIKEPLSMRQSRYKHVTIRINKMAKK